MSAFYLLPLPTRPIPRLATSMAGSSSQLYWAMTDGTANQVSTLVAGQNSSPFQSIDKNLAYMQLTLTSTTTTTPSPSAQLACRKTVGHPLTLQPAHSL